MILLVQGQKGGVGKSTLSTNLAVHLVSKGKSAVLVDLDPTQGSAYLWNQVRHDCIAEGAALPEVVCVNLSGKHVKKSLIDLEEKYGNVIVDTSGRDSSSTRSALLAADVTVCPVVPSLFDVGAAENTAAIVSELKTVNSELIAYALISRRSSHPKDNDALETVKILKGLGEDGKPLKEYGDDGKPLRDEGGKYVLAENPFATLTLLKTQIKDRSVWRKATGEGKSILEMPKSKSRQAVAEFLAFTKEIKLVESAT